MPIRMALAILLPLLCSAQQQPGQVAAATGNPKPDNTGKLPDTVSAPPFTVRDKFDYRVVQTSGLRGFGGALVSAAIGQGVGSPNEWGGGVAGFATRYASGFGGNLSRQTFAWTLESITHEDPRYFPSERKGFKARSFNALKQSIYCKTDRGNGSFAYGRVISSFANGQFVNVWQPASIGTVGDGIKRGFYTLGADTAYNFLQEFIRFVRPASLRHRH